MMDKHKRGVENPPPRERGKRTERMLGKQGEVGNGERGDKAVTAAAMLVVMATAGESR